MRFNTSARRSTRPSAGPERSELLKILPSLTVRQFFSVSAYFFLSQHWRMPIFGGRLVFPFANILYTPMFCRRQGFCMRQCFVDAKVFVCVNVLSMPRFLCAPMFFYIFVGAYIFVNFTSAFIWYAPIICWRKYLRYFRLIIVVMIMNCV